MASTAYNSRATGLGNRKTTEEQNVFRFYWTFETAVSAENMDNFLASSRTAQRQIRQNS